MAIKKTYTDNARRLSSIFSFLLFFFICGAFVFEHLIAGIKINIVYTIPVMLTALIIMSIIIQNTINYSKLAFNIPVLLYVFYLILILMLGWRTNHFFVMCFAFTVISCVYMNFARTTVFIILQNIVTGIFILQNVPIMGDVSGYLIYANWFFCLFASIVILILTRGATFHLTRALENQQSFMDLLDTTENVVAMVDEYNEVVYASKTLAQFGNTDEPTLIRGRPLIDMFPGKNLKIFAGRMLKEKEHYAEDWEFSLNGQKRFFKASSHSLRGGSGGALISLYDMTHLAERDEIAAMKDSMKIGLFFMDKDYVIQDHYSRYLEEMLCRTNLFGLLFTDVIADSITTNELNAVKDYFNMVLEHSIDQEMLDDINPLNELHYVNKETGDRKVFQCAFTTVERGHGEVFILVTVYDITLRVELQQRLAEEEARRQEEMAAVFELIQVEPDVFSDFMKDMECEFENINRILKSDTLSAHDALVKIYQAVHAIKSNAVILGLSVFGNKVHNLESKIKKLREMEGDVPFAEMLNLTMDIEKLSVEKEGFRDIIEKLQSYAGSSQGKDTSGKEKQNVKVLIESLTKTTSKAADDMGKQITFNVSDIDAEAIDKGPRRVIKEILMQLIRNSAVHGVELPEVRAAKGKNETGTIKLSIKMSEDHEHIHIKLNDDGQGLDYKKISKKAIESGIIRQEDAENKDLLIKAIFSAGFSTADVEGIHAGRGIGLNLVRDRIKEVNGTIKLRSEADKGVVFLMSIPVQEGAND
ncbi:MAG: ATP-binding protein [Treponema sp.]|nr:ATP-binding protein [Treponema sp.]